MPSEQYHENAFSSKCIFHLRESFRRYDLTKPLMDNNCPSIFPSHKIEEEISEHNAGVDNEQSRDRSYDIIEDQKAAEYEGSILRKWKPDATKDKEDKESHIGKLSDNGRYLRHRRIIAQRMNRRTDITCLLFQTVSQQRDSS